MSAVRKRRRADSWRRYQKKRLARLKSELVRLKGGRCVDCGYSTHVSALEFHHRDSATKDFRIGGFGGSWGRALAEAQKCDLVCANCHRVRHAREHDCVSAHAVTRARRRIKARAVAMRGARCERCGYARHQGALEFHHLDPEVKAFAISEDGIPRSWERIDAELAKCVLLCANCHREAHAGLSP